MKKNIIISMLLYCLVISRVLADATDQLKNRLNKVSSFHASFTQKVTDGDGNVILENLGELWVKRPSQFNWHVILPDEITLISDGKTLWLYKPFIEQATAICLKDVSSNNSFFMLIASNSASDWRSYYIKQIGDNFELTPKSSSNNSKKFIINVSNNGTINQFSVIDDNDLHSIYHFSILKNSVIDKLKFTFTLPLNVTLDDLRNQQINKTGT